MESLKPARKSTFYLTQQFNSTDRFHVVLVKGRSANQEHLLQNVRGVTEKEPVFTLKAIWCFNQYVESAKVKAHL